jgi:hypothetical protein
MVIVYLIVRNSMGLDCKAIGYLFPGNIPIGSQVYAYRGNIRGRGIYPVGEKRGYPLLGIPCPWCLVPSGRPSR